MEINKVYNEDASLTMDRMNDRSVNLIMTSPPYADARKGQYDGVDPDEFVEWFERFAFGFRRILTQDGSLIINIGDVTKKGETHLFVFDLIIMMKRRMGFCFIDPLIWHKKTCPPGKYPNRFKDAWEYCLHFSLQTDIKFRPEAVARPANPESIARAKRHKKGQERESGTGSGFTNSNENTLRRIRKTGSPFTSNDAELESQLTALPSNVLYLSPETINRNHPAVYPVTIPGFFIRALTDEGDLVYDPFTGSGTTWEASARLNRPFVGSELKEAYIPEIYKRVHPFLNRLF